MRAPPPPPPPSPSASCRRPLSSSAVQCIIHLDLPSSTTAIQPPPPLHSCRHISYPLLPLLTLEAILILPSTAQHTYPPLNPALALRPLETKTKHRPRIGHPPTKPTVPSPPSQLHSRAVTPPTLPRHCQNQTHTRSFGCNCFTSSTSLILHCLGLVHQRRTSTLELLDCTRLSCNTRFN